MPGDSCFVDTNIWVYAHLKAKGDDRHARALALVSEVHDAIISPQVIAEYYNVMLRNGRDDRWIQGNLALMFELTRLQPANAGFVNRTIEVRNRYKFSYWDCQIVSAALLAGCATLYTEDLQSGQLIEDSLRVVNPFAA
jgi:predicted nucleic acid-binding protein